MCSLAHVWLLYGIVVGIGGIVSMSMGGIMTSVKQFEKSPVIPGWILASGALNMMLAMFSCVMAVHVSKVLGLMYGLLMAGAIGTEIAIMGKTFDAPNTLEQDTREWLQSLIKPCGVESPTMDTLQRAYNCCGVDGFNDWDGCDTALQSCCYIDNCNTTITANLKSKGCANAVYETLATLSHAIGILFLTLCSLQFLLVITITGRLVYKFAVYKPQVVPDP